MSAEPLSYEAPSGNASEEEIDDFIASNPLLDEDVRERLLDPGLLGFHNAEAIATDESIAEFRSHVEGWSKNASWLGADLPWLTPVHLPLPSESEIWRPSDALQPGWVSQSPTARLVATVPLKHGGPPSVPLSSFDLRWRPPSLDPLVVAWDLLKSGRLLAELPWRTFEELVGQLLEAEGWTVDVTRPSKDGGIDVVAVREDETLGAIRSIWQAKRYGPSKKVRLAEVRELGSIVDIDRATKGVIVTTGRLTRGSLDWIRRDQYRLDYKDSQKLQAWVESKFKA